MIPVRKVLMIPIRNTLLLLSLMLCSAVAVSEDAAVAAPKHATPINYGKGWECKQGFRDAGDSCDPVVVPENAYPTNAMYGKGWKCERGYLETEGECVAIKVPPNGYLTDRSFKPGWECERGYRANAETCSAITVPDQGYLTDDAYGTGWKCDRGYRQVKDECIAIQVPENANAALKPIKKPVALYRFRKTPFSMNPVTAGSVHETTPDIAIRVYCDDGCIDSLDEDY